MKKSDLIEEIRKVHESGRLIDAKAQYLELLKTNPNDALVLDLLSMLLAELGDFEDAESYIKQAIFQDQSNPVLYLHLANILKAKGSLPQATLVLLDLTKSHPHFAPAFNNLGTIYFAEEKWEKAIENYKAAINIKSDYLDAYYNLGLALSKLRLNNEAILVYQSLLHLLPRHFAARFQLACLYMELQQYEDAISHFLLILKDHPFHVETEVNLASCFLKSGQIDQAKMHYRQALVMLPTDTQILFNLGVISMQQGRLYDAIEYYLRLEKAHPDYFPVQQNLGAAFLTIKKRDEALLHFRKALKLMPDNQSVLHLVHVLSQDKPLSCSPPEYIKTLFDSYADHYDAHLVTTLHYQVPQLFYQAIKATYSKYLKIDMRALTEITDEKPLDILDLGCGTGLCGEQFAPLAKSLTGVDISSKMLEIASQKKIYDELIEGDIISFLQDKHAAFDLILAGDVLVYFGDLSLLFTLVSSALRDQGLFVFNTEISDEKDHELKETGRFAHHLNYVKDLASKHHLIVLEHDVLPLREDQQEKIIGHLFVLQNVHKS
jgi:predicted TPR repeat methyltransferase